MTGFPNPENLPQINPAPVEDVVGALAMMHASRATADTSVDIWLHIDAAEAPVSRADLAAIAHRESDKVIGSYIAEGLITAGLVQEGEPLPTRNRITQRYVASPLLRPVIHGYQNWYARLLSDKTTLSLDDIAERASLALADVYLLPAGEDIEEILTHAARVQHISSLQAKQRMLHGAAALFGVEREVMDEVKQAVRTHPATASGRRAGEQARKRRDSRG